jgi:hypothetical protein
MRARRGPSGDCAPAAQSRLRPDEPCCPGLAPSGSGSPSRTAHARAGAARCPRAGSHRQGCRMAGRPGTAARSETPVAARDRARRRLGSGGSSPPPPGTPGRAARPGCAGTRRGFCRASCSASARTLARERRSARRVRIGPFLPDQAPAPGQQGARCHDPAQPQVPEQQPRQGGEHGTVSPAPGARPAGARPRPRAPTPARKPRKSTTTTTSAPACSPRPWT